MLEEGSRTNKVRVLMTSSLQPRTQNMTNVAQRNQEVPQPSTQVRDLHERNMLYFPMPWFMWDVNCVGMLHQHVAYLKEKTTKYKASPRVN